MEDGENIHHVSKSSIHPFSKFFLDRCREQSGLCYVSFLPSFVDYSNILEIEYALCSWIHHVCTYTNFAQLA
jgi:hypothetical protein